MIALLDDDGLDVVLFASGNRRRNQQSFNVLFVNCPNRDAGFSGRAVGAVLALLPSRPGQAAIANRADSAFLTLLAPCAVFSVSAGNSGRAR